MRRVLSLTIHTKRPGFVHPSSESLNGISQKLKESREYNAQHVPAAFSVKMKIR